MKKWNEKTKLGLRRLQLDAEKLADSKHKVLESNAERTFRDLRIMIWATFVFGLSLVLISLALFVAGQQTISVLGLGTLGVADWMALFFYKPMDRLQTADKDYLQQIIAVKGWALCINLEMLAMRVEDPVSLREASRNVRTVSSFVSHSLQEFVSALQSNRQDASTSPQTQPTTQNKTP